MKGECWTWLYPMFKFLFLNTLNLSYKTIVSMYSDQSTGESLVMFTFLTYSPVLSCNGENNHLLSGDVLYVRLLQLCSFLNPAPPQLTPSSPSFLNAMPTYQIQSTTDGRTQFFALHVSFFFFFSPPVSQYVKNKQKNLSLLSQQLYGKKIKHLMNKQTNK